MNKEDKSIELYKGYKPLCYLSKDKVLVFKNMKFYSFNINKKSFSYICSLSNGKYNNFLSKFRIFQRVLRLEPRTAELVNENEVLVSFKGNIFLLDIKKRELLNIHTFRDGMSSVLSFCCIKNIKGFDNGIYYGEYFSNKGKEPTSIFKYDEENRCFTKVFTFEENTINHIHQILPDKYRNRIWIFTGDFGSAAAIWYTDDNFITVNKCLYNKQLYRACKAFVIPKGIIYATDTPLEQNYIRIIELQEDNKIKEKNLFEINGSSIYGVECNGHYIWSTTVEPYCDENYKISMLFSYRRGTGIKSWHSEIISLNLKENTLNRINIYKKDIYPMGLFQFGSIMFIEDTFNTRNLIYYGSSLQKIDNKFIMEREIS